MSDGGLQWWAEVGAQEEQTQPKEATPLPVKADEEKDTENA